MRSKPPKSELASLRAENRRLRKALARQSAGLEVLLRRRGFRMYKKEPTDDLLIPGRRHLTGYYRMLHKYSFRLFLRDVIKHQELFCLTDVARYAAPRVTQHYIDYLLSIGVIRKQAAGYRLAKRPVTSFGPTLEWYLAELMRREFAAEASWGVKFRRPNVGGDYDLIAGMEGALVYGEVKSSPPKQIYDSEIAAFLDRVADLGPEVALFLMDTELRMYDKLVPMFRKELRSRFRSPPRVIRMEHELFHVRNRIFIVNSKDSILRNIEKVLSWYYQHAAAVAQERVMSRRTSDSLRD